MGCTMSWGQTLPAKHFNIDYLTLSGPVCVLICCVAGLTVTPVWLEPLWLFECVVMDLTCRTGRRKSWFSNKKSEESSSHFPCVCGTASPRHFPPSSQTFSHVEAKQCLCSDPSAGCYGHQFVPHKPGHTATTCQQELSNGRPKKTVRVQINRCYIVIFFETLLS